MKMTINEVLECVNKAIDEIRKERNITAKGHFVATVEIKKAVGPYKQCVVGIVYINMDKRSTHAFCGASVMERCLSKEEGNLVKKTIAEALTTFFLYQHNVYIWEQVITGEYGDK